MEKPSPPPYDPDPRPHRAAPAGRAGLAGMLRDPGRLVPLLLGVLALLLVVALATRGGSGVGEAREDLKDAAENVREKERAVAKAQQELEERLADLTAARAQAEADAVKLNAEASKERRDVRDTMVAGGEVVVPGDAERRASEALERSRETLGPVERRP